MKTFLTEKKKDKKGPGSKMDQPKKRNKAIEKSAGRELDLSTRTVPDKTKYNRKEKHKGKNMQEVVVEDFVPVALQKLLETMAGVNKDSYQTTERGVKFTFENSLQANQCQIIKYQDKILVEFRKKTNNLLEGKNDRLVFEDVIDPRSLQETFENVSGIYLSFLGL